MKFHGVNHVALATGNMDVTLRFWRDLLGMRLLVALGHPGYRHYFFEISSTDMVAFFEWPGVEPMMEKDHGAPVRGPFGFDHLAIGVEDPRALWELKDKLEAAGFWVSEVVDHGFIQSIYTFDPNNIPLEFTFASRGEEVRARPMMSDTGPSIVALEGPEPRNGRWPEVKDPTRQEDRKIYPAPGSELFHVPKRHEKDG